MTLPTFKATSTMVDIAAEGYELAQDPFLWEKSSGQDFVFIQIYNMQGLTKGKDLFQICFCKK